MTVTFYAQPKPVLGRMQSDQGNLTAAGFYFADATSYRETINSVVNDFAHLIWLDDLLNQQGDLFGV